LGLIRELLAIVDVAVSTATIERFYAEMTDSSTSSRQRHRFNRRGDCVQKATRRRTASVSANLAPSTASPPAAQRLNQRTFLRANKSTWSSTAKAASERASFASNFVQYLRDCGIAHWAIDSDHENAIPKRFIAVATPDVAKTLNFLRSGFGAAPLLSSKVQRLCSPFPEMQPSRVVFPSTQLRKLRRALHSDNARSLRYAQNPLR
jgi:hypothetical protein